MKSFFLGNGFDEVIDQPTFEVKPGFCRLVGRADEDMFNELHHRLMQDGNKRQFTLAFSVSNHTPWEYPSGRIKATDPAASVQNTVRYAAWSIGKFFARAKKSPYWKHTVFLIVADHDARVFGVSLVPVTHFHIPAVILGAGVPMQRDEHIVSQLDLAPTLLSLIGINNVNPMLGADLTGRYPSRAIMPYGDNYGYLSEDQLLVLRPGKAARQFHDGVDGQTLTTPADSAQQRAQHPCGFLVLLQAAGDHISRPLVARSIGGLDRLAGRMRSDFVPLDQLGHHLLPFRHPGFFLDLGELAELAVGARREYV